MPDPARTAMTDRRSQSARLTQANAVINPNRRQLLTSAAAGLAIWSGVRSRAVGFQSPNARPRIAVIGTGSRWDQRATGLDGPHGCGKEFPQFGDIVAVCDADADRRERARALVKTWGMEAQAYADYRQIIDRDDIDVVHVSTPDHWHAKLAIEAMLSGKDVYCEKPMTLTIAEGQRMCEVCRRTGRIVQIGTQQRSSLPFLQAIALIRAGRIGQVTRAECRIGGAPTSPEIPVAAPPKTLDWNQWLGPAPWTEFRHLPGPNGETQSWSRGHYEFRWWYEYSGGKLTDWGAHHVDIATWALGKHETGPVTITPVRVEHPVPFRDGYPTLDNRYNTATSFYLSAKFDDGVELVIRDDEDNGIMFEGTEGRLFVNRGRVTGRAVDDLASQPLPDGALEQVYKGQPLTDHTANFFQAVAARREPISDVFSHHRALTTCHLAGIAARFNRPLRWDPVAEQILDDAPAQGLLRREPRTGFAIEV